MICERIFAVLRAPLGPTRRPEEYSGGRTGRADRPGRFLPLVRSALPVLPPEYSSGRLVGPSGALKKILEEELAEQIGLAVSFRWSVGDRRAAKKSIRTAAEIGITDWRLVCM